MTLVHIRRRLDRIERRRPSLGSLEHLSDAQLWGIVRQDYPALVSEHGSMSAAIQHLRTTGEAVLAALIEEDTGGADAIRH